jgi:hypothetical protein
MTRLQPDALWAVAERIHRGGMFAAKFKTPEAVFTAMMLMQELGFEAVSGLSSIHMIHNVPALSSRALLSLVLRRGYRLAWTERSETAAEVTVTHAEREGSHTVRYAIEDAKRAGLLSNRAWQTMPRSMLTARALSELVSSWCADVLGGATIYTEEEVGDFAKPAAPPPPPEQPDHAKRIEAAIEWLTRRGLMAVAVAEYGPTEQWDDAVLADLRSLARRHEATANRSEATP